MWRSYQVAERKREREIVLCVYVVLFFFSGLLLLLNNSLAQGYFLGQIIA